MERRTWMAFLLNWYDRSPPKSRKKPIVISLTFLAVTIRFIASLRRLLRRLPTPFRLK